jgi:hypothetical protein
MWRGGDSAKKMKVYVTTTVNFGDKPAGCIAIAAIRETAERFGGDYPEASWFLKYRTYVDDATAGANSMERLRALSKELEVVAKKGGFEFKETLMSGDSAADPSEPRKVLGLIWETQEDRLMVDVKLNLGPKRAGLKLEEDVDLTSNIEGDLPGLITKRELWRVAQGQYDPLGLLCAYTVRFKIVMRSLAEEQSGRVVGWDEPVPPGTDKVFREIISHLGELRKISFPRSAQPLGKIKGKPILMVFGDGSVEASCALAYLRWELQDGTVECRLLAGKTRVAPKCKVSIPRMELMGSLLAVRLAQKIRDSLQMELGAVRFFTDSSAVLGMLSKDSASFLEFVGNRVSEIKIKSNPETDWFWIPGELNPADMGTRPTVLPADMGPETPYQRGRSWMRLPVREWPVRKDFTAPPLEECRKDILHATCAVVLQGRGSYSPKINSRAKLERVYGYVFMAVAKLRKEPNWAPLGTFPTANAKGARSTGFRAPASKYRQAAREYLIEEAQKELKPAEMESLMTDKIICRTGIFAARTIRIVGGRMKKHLKIAYDQAQLPVLPTWHTLARLYLQEAHCVDHAGLDAMVMRSKSHVWIIAARRLAKVIKNNCFFCKRLFKVTGEQIMAPLPEHRMGPAPVFSSTAVDLFGPLTFNGTVNKRSTAKAWGVVFVCTATSLVHVEITESYSTDAFLLALRRFMALHGAPKRFQSDQGTQLVAASKQVASWDWTAIHQFADGVGVDWQAVPTGAQHFNGQAERIIGLVKKCLTQTLEGKTCSYGELSTIVAEAAQMVNSRPIARNSEDPSSGGPITPLHLQLGRATVGVPQVRFEESPQLTRRLQYVEEVKRQFWAKWMQQVFQGRVLAQQWRKPKRDVMPGDVVMLAEAEVEDPVYHLGKVDSVKTGEDGHVRTVSIQYTNPGRNPQERSPMKVTTRPIHKIAVIVPVDYRFEDDQGPSAMEQRKTAREASPPPEAARIQELPRSISWADEMEEEYELNGPPPDLDPGEVSWAAPDHDDTPRETGENRRGQQGARGRPARDLGRRPALPQEPSVKRGRTEATARPRGRPRKVATTAAAARLQTSPPPRRGWRGRTAN